jgi:hypothetical protein
VAVRDEIKPVQAIKILKNWKKMNVLKILKKKKPLIFSLWAHQMKIIEDHIVFIKIFCCRKLKNCSLSSLFKSNFQTIQTIWLFEWFETGLISSLVAVTMTSLMIVEQLETTPLLIKFSKNFRSYLFSRWFLKVLELSSSFFLIF